MDIQLFRVRHPYVDEAFRVAYVIPSLQVKVERVMIRGGLGPAFSSWSGSQRISLVEMGPALGAAIEVPLGGTRSKWFVELGWRGGSTSDLEMSMSLLTIQIAKRLR